MALPIRPGALVGLLRELRTSDTDSKPLVVTGALSDVLRRELTRAGGADAVREGPVEGAAALIHVLAAAPSEEDERLLGAAHRARVPIVVVLAGPGLPDRIPNVLATDIVGVPAGSGFPVDEIAGALANRLGEEGTGLAARLPVLRRPLAEHLVVHFARRSAVIGVAVFVPGADFPVLTLYQLRMVLRIAIVYGEELEPERVPEVLAVIGSGLVFRAIARQALTVIPFAGWLVKGAVAYAGTRALGEAAIRYFEVRG